MASLIRSVIKLIKEKGISNLWKEDKHEGFLDAIADGNLINSCIPFCMRASSVISLRNDETEEGRHRSVEYGDKKRYNASSVPAEWHGWLHYITDHTPEQLQMFKPKRYGEEHQPNLTGEEDEFTYHSKGYMLNPSQRDWTRYEPWQPTKARRVKSTEGNKLNCGLNLG